jgi:hypothetical protein
MVCAVKVALLGNPPNFFNDSFCLLSERVIYYLKSFVNFTEL